MSGWVPQAGTQTAAIMTAGIIDELLFGGARGGGKSDFLLGDYGQDVGKGYGAAWRGVLIRRTIPEIRPLIERSKAIFRPWFGAHYHETKHTWTFPDGATLLFQHMQKEAEAELLQGGSYAWIGMDELGNWSTLAHWNMLKATLRSAEGIPIKRMRGSANPGGRGHLAIKEYFKIGEHPGGMTPYTDPETGMTRMFIKSRVQDNRILLENDPNYIRILRGTGSEALVRAWLDGDWDAIIGAYFDCWRSELHVVRPFALPMHWLRFRSFDWGFASPLCCQWWAVASEDHPLSGNFYIPKGSMICFREWYGAEKDLTGLRLRDEDIAAGILARERNDPPLPGSKSHVAYGVADPAIFASRPNGMPGPTIAEAMATAGCFWRPADNGRMAGWQQMRSRMIGEHGTPLIYWFDTCSASIRTMPALQHDELDPEDLDTEGEDHAADTARYACMSRPWIRKKPEDPEDIKGMDGLTLDRLFAQSARDRRNRNRHPWRQ